MQLFCDMMKTLVGVVAVVLVWGIPVTIVFNRFGLWWGLFSAAALYLPAVVAANWLDRRVLPGRGKYT